MKHKIHRSTPSPTVHRKKQIHVNLQGRRTKYSMLLHDEELTISLFVLVRQIKLDNQTAK